MAHFTNRRINLKLIVLFFGLLLVTLQPVQVLAADYKYDPLDVPMYKPDDGICSVNAGAVSSSNKVVFIGDSLTVAMSRADLLQKVKASGLDINTEKNEFPDNSLGFPSTTVSGPSIEATNGINMTNMLPRIASIRDLPTAGIVVIGLGTNREDGVQEKVEATIDEVRRNNPNNPKIYWVNVHYDASAQKSFEDTNKQIDSAATTKGFTVINWAGEVKANPDKYPYQSDGTHLAIKNSVSGDANKADFIITQIGGKVSLDTVQTGTNASASFNPISLTYPNFPNETEIINKLKDHITKNYSRSPFASNLQYVDSIFSLSKKLGVNPLLTIAIAQQENGYGGASSSATQFNNYFGIKQGGNYRQFTTVDEGIEYFINTISRHVTTPDGNYVNVRTFYEYISVHQAGVLAYPGEYPVPGSRGADATPPYLSGDPLMGGVLVSWDPTANSNRTDAYKDKIYNPGIYYENSITLINKLTGLNLSKVPSRNGDVAFGSCDASGAQLSGPPPGSKSYTVDGFVIYKQEDPAWAKNPYGVGTNANGNDRTIGSSGCGPSAMAMIITALTKKYVTPADVSAFGMSPGTTTYSTGGGSDGVALAEKAAPNWGLIATHLGSDKLAINRTLQNGGYVIVSGQGGLPFSEGGHFVVIRALTASGKWLVGDSSHDSRKPDTSTVEYDPDTMIADFTAGGYSSYAITK